MTGRRPVRLLAITGATGWGGAEIVLGHLLASLGSHVEPVLLGVDPDVTQKVAAARPGMEVQLMPAARSRRDITAFLAQRRAIAAVGADIVQVNLPVPSAEQYTVLAAVMVPRSRVVVVEHLPMPIGSAPGRLLKRATSRRLAAHLAVGSGAAREVERMCGLPSGTVRPVPNGVPTPVPTHPAAHRTDGPVVGAVGRLDRQKGLDVLVRAVAELPDVQLVLVGDGPERTALEQLGRDLGLGTRLHITGWVEDPRSWLAGLDVMALPSRFEGLPLVLLEAMHAGLPVVATGVGSIPDALIDRETGLLVPPDDAAALREALRALLADTAQRCSMGAAARERARHRFTTRVMAASYEKVYDEILAVPDRT